MSRRFTLENGLKVALIPSDYTKECIVRLTIHSGSNSERTQRERGSAHLVEHMIFKGNGRSIEQSVEYEAGDDVFHALLVDDKLPVSETDTDWIARANGGRYNASTSLPMTSFYYTSGHEHTRLFVSWLSLILRTVKFNDEEINSEIEPVLQELEMGKMEFQRQAMYRIHETLFGITEPAHYRTIGTENSVINIKGSELTEFFNRHYVANNASLIVCGHIPNVQEMEDHIRKVYVNLRTNPSETVFEKFHEPKPIDERVSIVRMSKNPSPYHMFGMRIPGEYQQCLLDVVCYGLCGIRGDGLNEALISTGMCDAIEVFPERQHKSCATLMFVFIPRQEPQKVIQVIEKAVNEMVWDGEYLEKVKRLITMDQVNLFTNNLETFTYGLAEHAVHYGNIPDVTDTIKNVTLENVNHFVTTLSLVRGVHVMESMGEPRSDSMSSAPSRTKPLDEPLISKIVDIKEPVVDPRDYDVPIWFDASRGAIFVTPPTNSVFTHIEASIDAHDTLSIDDVPNAVIDVAVNNILCKLSEESGLFDNGIKITSRSMSFPISHDPRVTDEKIALFNEMRGRAIEMLNGELLDIVAKRMIEEQERASKTPYGVIKKNLFDRFMKEDWTYWGHDEMIKKLQNTDFKAEIEKYVEKFIKAPLVVTASKAHMTEIGCACGCSDDECKKFQLHNPDWEGREHVDMEIPQVYVVFARPGSMKMDDPDYSSMLKMLEFVQFGGLGSRLMRIRERDGLFYTANGVLGAMATKDRMGVDYIVTQLSPDSFDQYVEKIEELTDPGYWIENPITHGEFCAAKEAIIGNMRTMTHASSVARSVADKSFHPSLVSRLNAIKMRDLQRFAVENSTKEYGYLLTVGPEVSHIQ